MFLFKEIYICLSIYCFCLHSPSSSSSFSIFGIFNSKYYQFFFKYIFLLIHLFLFFAKRIKNVGCGARQRNRTYLSLFVRPSDQAIAMSICMSVCALERLQIPRLFVCLNNFYHRSRWAAWRYNSTRNKSGLNCRVHDTTTARTPAGPSPSMPKTWSAQPLLLLLWIWAMQDVKYGKIQQMAARKKSSIVQDTREYLNIRKNT